MICNKYDVISGSCTSIGCCQTSIPKGYRAYGIDLGNFKNHTDVFYFNPCNYAFVVETNKFKFTTSDLLNFTNSITEVAGYWFLRVPVVFNWTVDKKSCEEAKNTRVLMHATTTTCVISKNGVGYNCICSKGYHGNPYLPQGCQDNPAEPSLIMNAYQQHFRYYIRFAFMVENHKLICLCYKHK
ncbi:hypothetical protein NE237_005303 [Protea cynaroides]|uniref:Uncharacterized protein n=1 Tax=Protea cynaroides TaxID=273540 RepID=A0A9Q0KL33_9MAGN|nr:hypothetical protein NE237_005303 [Protea cynaroides]